MSLQAAVLVRFRACLSPSTLRLAASRSASAAQHAFTRIEANQALDHSLTYLYFWAASASVPSAESLADMAEPWKDVPAAAAGFEIARLEPVQDIPGASAGATAVFHYVVETDVEAENAKELADWYATEHLPGLAAVEGNIRARRLENLDASPRSFACYDLVTPAALESAPWLAVRGTAWSSKVRPMFRNTRRTMFERVLTLDL